MVVGTAGTAAFRAPLVWDPLAPCQRPYRQQQAPNDQR
jgi:hypothetical protein